MKGAMSKIDVLALSLFSIRITKEINNLKYFKPQMQQLVKENRELHDRLKELMAEMDLQKNYALKALYHAEVADGGRYQQDYQALDHLFK